jgi:quercetin dioxygenase-like cupin family protein
MALEAMVINVNSADNGYTRILGGPPQSVSMRSGKVILKPGESVGEHSTKSNEELIIILEGEGQFLLDDDQFLEFNADSVLYCPPNTKHNILNSGSTTLSYVYDVARADCIG